MARRNKDAVVPSLENGYTGQETEAVVGYSHKYEGPRPLVEQIQTLARVFNLDAKPALAYAANLPPLPEGAEAWFAVVNDDVSVDRHRNAAARVLRKLMEEQIYGPYTESDTSGLTTVSRTEQMIGLVDDRQGWNLILVVAAQLGARHAGRSANRAEALMADNEFGLTVAQVGSIVLTHPGLVNGRCGLDLVCLGNTCPSRVIKDLPSVPNMGLSGPAEGDLMAYTIHSRDRFNATIGHPTGFVPA